MKLDFFKLNFEKYSHIKLNENPSSETRVVPQGQTDMRKLKVAFRDFSNAPKKVFNKPLLFGIKTDGISLKCLSVFIVVQA